MPARGGAWQGSKWIRRELRLAIYARDGFACLWCGTDRHLTLDHLYPAPPGAKADNRPRSLVTSCLSCNCTRRAKSLSIWLHYLREELDRDVRPIVAELRRRVRAPVDRALGRALRADPDLQKARRWTGSVFRRERLYEAEPEEAPCTAF